MARIVFGERFGRSCPGGTIVTPLGRMCRKEHKAGMGWLVGWCVHSFLPVSYVISRPFFSNPSFYDVDDDDDDEEEYDPLGSFSPPSNREAAIPPQQWDSSTIGNKLCSAKSDGKMTKPRNYNFYSSREREIKRKRRRKKGGGRGEGKKEDLPFPAARSFFNNSR